MTIFRATAAIVALVSWTTAAAAQQTVRYEPAATDLKFVYATAPPVATLKPGDILETKTFDAFGNVIKKPGDTMAMVKGDNPLTGPFAIAGAEPGDTLVVTFLDLAVDSNRGVGALAPGFGALNTTNYTPMLNANLPEKIWFYDIDSRTNEATFHALDSGFTVKIPLQPFLGCIGVAPAGGEARSSVVPAEFGGNMDASEARPGYTLYLPVNAPGALLYLGDGRRLAGRVSRTTPRS
jgi:amidase